MTATSSTAPFLADSIRNGLAEAVAYAEGTADEGLGGLIHMKKYKEAIEIFKLSVDAYPQSYNTFDSLAEAYMDNGDTELAIKNYQRSIEINSGQSRSTLKMPTGSRC